MAVDPQALRKRIEAAKARAAETRAHLAAATDPYWRQRYEHELRVHEHAIEVEERILAADAAEPQIDLDEVRRRMAAARARADEARARLAAAPDAVWRERFEHELRVHERAIATEERVMKRLGSSTT